MELNNCIICNGTRLKTLPAYSRAFLVKCEDCGIVFCKKIPSGEELTAHYANYPRYENLSSITEKRYNELLDRFEPFRKNNNLIDIGCSNGLFLECAKKRGWNVYGTEYAQECIDYCAQRNITVFKSDKLPPEFFKLQFDVVTSFEVIEHINTPVPEMEFIKKILRKGGAFYVTTPNFNAISRLLLKEKWNVIEYPEHLSYYTPKTLNALMKKYGFKKQFLVTTGISLSRFNQSRGKEDVNRTLNDNVDENLRKSIEKNFLLLWAKNSTNFFLDGLKIGDAMKGLYINS
jgi:2-polyprenyl-3-methyl-5-hydroxy-6-metoxy-1,4-benzoquinol methylase